MKIKKRCLNNLIKMYLFEQEDKDKDQERKSDEYVITKVLQDIDPKEL